MNPNLKASGTAEGSAGAPLVSIVIPAFNAERFLPETIESAISQTYTRLEIVVVDDGSTDSTFEIADHFRVRDERIRVLKRTNSGVSVARNIGAAATRGPLLAFLDADDVLSRDSIELKVARFECDAGIGLVHCDYQRIDAASQPFGDAVAFLREGDVLDELLLLDETLRFFCVSACVVRREVFDFVGGFDPQLSNGADHEFFFRVAHKHRVARVPGVGLLYRVHDSNMHYNLHLLEHDLLASYSKADKLGLFRSPLFKRACFANMYFDLAGSWWRNGNNKWKGGKYVVRALLTHPGVARRLVRKLSRGVRRAESREHS